MGAFNCSNFTKKLSPRFFLLRPAICCLNCNLFEWFIYFAMFSNDAHCFSSLGEFQLRQNRDEDFASLLQVAPQSSYKDLHNNLQINSALLPLEPGTRVPQLGMEATVFNCGWAREGGGAMASKMPRSFSTVFKLTFSGFCVHLVNVNLWLFSIVLTKFLLISRYFCGRIWSLEAPT